VITVRRSFLVHTSLAVGTVLAAALGGPLTQPAAASPSDAQVVVVHAIRGFVADLYVDGRLVLAGFNPNRVTDPLTVSAGSHAIAVRPAGAAASSAPALAGSVDLVAGEHLSVVAYLASGHPSLATFTDDVSMPPNGSGRLVVRDLAAGPGVTVAIDGNTFATGLAVTHEKTGIVSAGTHQVAVTNAGTAVLPLQPIAVSAAATTVLYLTGGIADHTVGWLVAALRDAPVPLAGVPAGSGGLAAPAPFPTWPVLVSLFGAVALVAGPVARRLRRRRC
jgi:hypothetical protein